MRTVCIDLSKWVSISVRVHSCMTPVQGTQVLTSCSLCWSRHVHQSGNGSLVSTHTNIVMPSTYWMWGCPVVSPTAQDCTSITQTWQNNIFISVVYLARSNSRVTLCGTPSLDCQHVSAQPSNIIAFPYCLPVDELTCSCHTVTPHVSTSNRKGTRMQCKSAGNLDVLAHSDQRRQTCGCFIHLFTYIPQ